ncbi:MAG: D-tyrosyl-tRNA(Tyr) deacylase [Ignavibacteriae bacterium HGW-Ignavibacteriae-1]|jgi:D-tyrosyl-tRNA(Tyr) deacylase|nr:MAG: D-tyrosyl-tRNA(Tyr) deacylase [Ignavibacteriae bacterium HGW-Ignavibacteriae-1]
MKVVVQRVKSAKVTVEGAITGQIDKGLLLLAGVCQADTPEILDWVCNKIAGLRIFSDENQKMNLSVQDVGGSILVVSNFTVCGNAAKGFRPSFTNAAAPEFAEKMYEKMIAKFREMNIKTEAGIFGAMMDVELINDGPVTVIIEKKGADTQE